MLWSSRRAILVLSTVASLAIATSIPLALAQRLQPAKVQVIAQPGGLVPQVDPANPNPLTSNPGEFSDNISLPTDPREKQRIQAAIDYIKEKNWVTATDILQKLIDRPEDVFVPLVRKGADEKETTVWTSVKTEAHRLISTLPPEGLDFYKLTFGPQASTMLKEAKENNNIEQLSTVMARFLHTDAGADATNLLGTYYLDRGSYVTAGLCFKRLFNRDALSKLSTLTLFKSAYAFHMAGDNDNKERAWQELSRRGQNFNLGAERHSVDELQNYVAALKREGNERNINDWGMYGGTPSRNGKGEGDTPFLSPQWRRPTFEQTTTKTWIDQASAFVRDRKLPFLPATFPITATVTKDGKKLPLLVYRSHWGIFAVNVKTGDLAWKAASAWSLDTMVSKPNKQTAVNSWVNYYLQTLQKPTLLFENSTVGTLSTDNSYVYAIEDLAVSPPPTMGPEFDPRFGQGGAYQRYDQAVSDAIQHNKLQAYDLVTGKLKWELGGRGEKHGDMADCYFLGPPMPIAGKLYALTEKNQDLRLVCIDALAGKVLYTQTLASTKDKMQQDALRRMQAAHMAYGEGMLICPTNSGAILGVDQLTKSLVWAYPYRQKAAQTAQPEEALNPRFGRRFPPPGWVMGPDGRWMPPVAIQSNWQVTAPIIQDGKVVFTAPDAKSVHCINLRDGSPVWAHPRAENDLFLAGVFNGKVLIVGKHKVRALNLSKGEQLWEREVGLPSGQGIASDNIYYLPVKAAAQTNEPEICAIDMERGVIHAHTKSRTKEVPGNLIFYEGEVVSQTLTEIVAFPQLKVKLAQIDKLIKENPNDPVGLTERGELRLDKGDLQGAIDDLATALKNSPPKEIQVKARVKLYETLTEYFQRDFNAAEKYIKEYEDLCKVDTDGAASEQEKQDRLNESRRRRANFLCLVAKGKETQRKLVEAFEKYMEFSALAGKDELISVIDEPSVRAAADVWSQGRIRAMADSAKPEERKPLEDRIANKWKELQNASNLDDLKNFVNVFGSLFKVGKEARLQLAERLMEDSDPMALLEAERHLYLLRGPHEEPALSARAVECLARLNTRKGMLKDAAYYYRVLRRDFANVTVLDGKTGNDIFDEQATDKRLLPFIDEPDRLGSGGKISHSEERGSFPYQIQTYQLGQLGEKLPFFQENQFVVRYQPQGLRMLDRASGEEKWNQLLTQTMFQNLVYGNGQPNSPKFPFLNLGHLIVLPLGHMVFGIDPINRKVLWEKNLHASSLSTGPAQAGPPNHTQLTVDPRDGSILVTYPDGWVQRLGTTGPLEGNVICLQTRDALLGLDPVTGRTLWIRSDVSPRNQIFGDDQVLYVVEMNQDNRAASTKALRAYDGVSIKVPDFATLYEKRIGQVGRTLALAEPTPTGGTLLRLYDVSTGKDVWTSEFPAGSIRLGAEDHNLAGMVEPDGKVRVVDLRTHKEVLTSRVDPRHFTGAQQIWLLSDSQDYYLAVNGPQNPQLMPFGPVQTNMMAGTGLRALPVNGYVYCFNGANGKLRWYNLVPNQMLLLEHFRELPIVLFASRFQQWNQQGPGRNVIWHVGVRSIKKDNGKLVYESTNIPNSMNFHALNVDARGGKVELIGHQMKIVHHLNGDHAAVSR